MSISLIMAMVAGGGQIAAPQQIRPRPTIPLPTRSDKASLKVKYVPLKLPARPMLRTAKLSYTCRLTEKVYVDSSLFNADAPTSTAISSATIELLPERTDEGPTGTTPASYNPIKVTGVESVSPFKLHIFDKPGYDGFSEILLPPVPKYPYQSALPGGIGLPDANGTLWHRRPGVNLKTGEIYWQVSYNVAKTQMFKIVQGQCV